MSPLTFSAAGGANLFATNKKLDLAKLDPRLLEGVTSAAPSATSAETEANAAPAQSLRARLLEALALTEDDLLKMPAQTRSDLEEQIARDAHRDVTARARAQNGAYLDIVV